MASPPHGRPPLRKLLTGKSPTNTLVGSEEPHSPGKENPTPKEKKGKLAKLMGDDVAGAQMPVDKNAEARRAVVRVGFQIPDYEPQDAIEDLELTRLYDLHQGMPDYFSPRFDGDAISVATGPGKHYHVLFEVRQVAMLLAENAQLFFSLYHAAKREFISEEYCVRLTPAAVQESGYTIRCLFVDVHAEEINGPDGAVNNLYVVCRVYRMGDLVPPGLGSTAGPSGSISVKSPSKRDLSDSKSAGGSDLPIRRPYGVAVMPIRAPAVETLRNRKIFAPPQAKIYTSAKENDFSLLHEQIIAMTSDSRASTSTAVLSEAKNTSGIQYGVLICETNNINAFGPKEILNFNSLTQVPRAGLSEIDDSKRNFLYVTLEQGDYLQGRKTTAKNVMCRMSVRANNDLDMLHGALSRGKGQTSEKVREYMSSVFYHCNSPVWNERICVTFPPGFDHAKYHLYFQFLHVSGTAKKDQLDWFSFSYLPLANETGALVADQLHKPPIYKHSKKELVNHSYQTYDRATVEKRQTKEKFLIRTQLVSTEISQDTDINRIISWRVFPQGELIKAVKSLAGKPKAGVSTMLSTILDAILDMLTAPEDQFPYAAADNQLHLELLTAFVQLVASLGVSPHPKHKHQLLTTPALQNYMDGKCNHPGAHVCFVRFIRHKLQWAVDDTQVNTNRDNQFRDLSNILKSLEPLLRIVFHNYQDDANPNRIKVDKLRQLFVGIFQDLATLMTKEKPTWRLALQRMALASFGKLVSVVGDSGVMDTLSLVTATQYFFSKINSVDTTDGFALIKLQVLQELVKSHPRVVDPDDGSAKKRKRRMGKHGDEDPLLRTNEWRRPMLETILSHIETHLQQSMNEQLAVVSLLLCMVPHVLPASVAAQVEEKAVPKPLVKADKEKQVDFDKRKRKEEKRAKRKAERKQLFNEAEDAIQEEIMPRIHALVPAVVSLFYTMLATREGENASQAFLATVNKDLRKSMSNVFVDTAVCVLGLMVQALDEKAFLILLTKLRARSVATERDFLYKVFVIAEHMTRQSVFPKYWIMMRLKELKLGIQTIKWTNEYCVEYYLSDAAFDADLWRKFSLLGTSVLLAPEMNIETLSGAKKHYMEERYHDQRAKIAKQLHQTWSGLGGKQIELIEVLAGPLIDLTQSQKSEVQLMAGTLYFTLCQCEFAATGTFRKVQYHTIDEVGRVVQRELAASGSLAGKSHTTDELKSYRAFFHTELMEAFAVDAALMAEGATFLKEIDELFDRIMTLESLPAHKKYEDERTSACIDLLFYLKRSNKTLMYETYTQRLSYMHRDLKNCVEWGNALMQHQETLRWDEKWLESNLELPAQSQTQRKIYLYEQAIKAYDEGKAWENSIQVSQLLAKAYETVTYDILGLTRLLRQQADYFDKIMHEDRIFNAYYRVVFLGSGMPDTLRGKEFVYRSGDGVAPEGVREFTLRIKEKFPDAQIVNGSDLPPAAVLDDKKGDGPGAQYVQITTLQVSSKEELHKQPTKWESAAHPLPGRMLKYHQVHNVDHFTYSRVAKEFAKGKANKSGGDNYRELWTMKYYLITKEPLPGLQRRVEVVEKREVLMVPLENAVSTIAAKNHELRQLCNELKADETGKMSLGPLTMQLSGVIDAAVQGGVEKYREAFFDGSYIAEFPDHAEFIPQFKEQLSKQLEILRVGLDLFGAKCEDNLKPLHEHLSKTYDQMVADLKNIIT